MIINLYSKFQDLSIYHNIIIHSKYRNTGIWFKIYSHTILVYIFKYYRYKLYIIEIEYKRVEMAAWGFEFLKGFATGLILTFTLKMAKDIVFWLRESAAKNQPISMQLKSKALNHLRSLILLYQKMAHTQEDTLQAKLQSC